MGGSKLTELTGINAEVVTEISVDIYQRVCWFGWDSVLMAGLLEN
jgi:hypothetical protein